MLASMRTAGPHTRLSLSQCTKSAAPRQQPAGVDERYECYFDVLRTNEDCTKRCDSVFDDCAKGCFRQLLDGGCQC